jgi:hypothetical protein
MRDYANGKIYKIIDDTTGKKYIGSTTQKLSQRLAKHVNNYKNHTNGGSTKYISAFDVLENDNYCIILIENVNCDTKEELLKRERYYIETETSVNRSVPLRTLKEYRDDKREELKEKNKIYKKNNKDKIKAYNEKNKEHIAEQLKQYRLKNKDDIDKRNKTLITCSCGSVIQKMERSRHLKSKKHVNFVINN